MSHAYDEAWDDLNWSHRVDCDGCGDCETEDACAA